MNKIYLVITSWGSYEDYRENIERAFYKLEDAENFKNEYNENLRKKKYKEELKEKRGKIYDYDILYDTYDAKIKEVEIE